MKYKIGKRTIKTGIAVALSIGLAHLIGFTTTFSGVVALIAMKETSKRTVRYGVTLFLGSLLSVVIGLILGLFLGKSVIAFGLGTIIAIALIVSLHLADGIILATIVVYHVLDAMPIIGRQFISFSLKEIAVIGIGIVISVLVNLVAPQKYDSQLKVYTEDFNTRFASFLERMAAGVQQPELKSIPTQEEYYECRKRIKVLLDQAEISKENVLLWNESNSYDQYIAKLQLYKKLIALLEELTFQVGHLQSAHFHSKSIAGSLQQLSKMQKDPSANSIETFEEMTELLNRLDDRYANSAMPETREEFVDRAHLYHIFIYVREYADTLFLFYQNN
ncbi:aromatic acid exporter family protein [Tepidibacillus marianensis]|uniref:aromatic acid exporter family protein n=1 Tax=Tepidibacillus marianensis TaxID=3131995 RepID=UPI0030CB582B